MKVKALFFFVLVFVFTSLIYGYREALPSEVRIELSSDKTEYALYEPVLLHEKVTFLGNYASQELDAKIERTVSPGYWGSCPFWASGPFKPAPYQENQFTHTIGVVALPSSEGKKNAVLLPGDSLERDYWIYPNTGPSVTASPGDYEIWIAPEGDWVVPARRFESNHLKIRVVEPQGRDKEAFDYAKTPKRLLALMGGPGGIGPVTKEEIKAQPRGRAFSMKDDGIPFWQGFVRKSEGSVYHPFALFALSRAYFHGWAETRKMPTKRKDTFSREPDYELLLKSTDEFIKLYPDHPLADEAHLFRLVALYGLGKKDEATKEFEVIREKHATLEKALWEQFRKNGRRDWSDEQASAEMTKGPLYVLSAAEKMKDLFENNMVNGSKRKTTYDYSYSEWPVQVRDIEGQFESRWSPR